MDVDADMLCVFSLSLSLAHHICINPFVPAAVFIFLCADIWPIGRRLRNAAFFSRFESEREQMKQKKRDRRQAASRSAICER